MSKEEKEFKKYINIAIKYFLSEKLEWSREDIKKFANFLLCDYYFTPEQPKDIIPYWRWLQEILNKFHINLSKIINKNV